MGNGFKQADRTGVFCLLLHFSRHAGLRSRLHALFESGVFGFHCGFPCYLFLVEIYAAGASAARGHFEQSTRPKKSAKSKMDLDDYCISLTPDGHHDGRQQIHSQGHEK
jgi:hypothetical protein